MEEEKISVQEQIKTALDGRTRRWLSIKAGIAEGEINKKINGKARFSEDEIKKINEALNVVIIVE